MSFISTAPERFTYFDLQLGHPDWRGRKVLDFGGNKGALLGTGRIEERNYWCVDLSHDAIDHGKREYPQAHWIFYDRYNFAFNPLGIPGLPVPLPGERFDFILAYSVFTHTSRAEMFELVEVLRNRLTNEGSLAFTFIDPHYVLRADYSPFLWGKDQHTNLRLRLEKMRTQNPAISVDAMLREAAGARWCTLVNGCDLYIEHEEIKDYSVQQRMTYDTFYTAGYMRDLFPEAAIAACPESYDPGGGQMQHCCILRRQKEKQQPAQ
jgi:SAM-dependent methyltransferase